MYLPKKTVSSLSYVYLPSLGCPACLSTCLPACYSVHSCCLLGIPACLSFDLAAFLPVCRLPPSPSFCYNGTSLLPVVSVAILLICGYLDCLSFNNSIYAVCLSSCLFVYWLGCSYISLSSSPIPLLQLSQWLNLYCLSAILVFVY